MTHTARVRVDLAQIVKRFPDDAALVRELVLRDEMFRAMCEDHALASETLARLQLLSRNESQSGKIADCRELTAELELEISAALQRARTSR